MNAPILNTSTHPRTRQKGERSRLRLLEEATRLFGLYGYATVTMREIGAAAGLDNSTIYRYFASKEELAAEVVQRILQELAPLAQNLSGHCDPVLDELVDGIVAFSRHLWQRPHVARLLLAWMSTTGAERSGFSYSVKLSDNPNHPATRLVVQVADWFVRAQSAAVIRPVALTDAIVQILALAIIRPATAGYFLHSLESGVSPADRHRAAEAELRSTIAGAFAPLHT